MSDKVLTPEQADLKAFLEQWMTVRRQIGKHEELAYYGAHDFVLQHGVWYKPEPWTGEVRTGAPKQCFGNAIVLAATHGYRYVEGYALADGVPFMEIHHAWNLDRKGRLIDSTWLNTGVAYLGVEFSAGRAYDAIWNADASVLDDWGRRFPLFRQPWTGEAPNLSWPGYKNFRRKCRQSLSCLVESEVPYSR